MNNARFISIEQGLPSTAKKVLDATPAQEHWNIGQICAELHRQGHNMEHKSVLGLLRTMVEQGVVLQPEPNYFVRVNPKPKPPKPTLVESPAPPPAESHDPVVAAPVASPPDEASAIKRMIDIVADVRALAASATKLAADIEDAALDMEARIERLHADTGKLRQLQNLLKSIGQ